MRRVSGLNSPRFEGSVAWRDAQTAAMFDVPYHKSSATRLAASLVLSVFAPQYDCVSDKSAVEENDVVARLQP
eukprot:scaffold7246_cov136-Skeletonema_marinoi.AAC.7